MPRLERIPTVPYLSGRCQRFSNIGNHGAVARIRGRVRWGLGIRSGIRSLLRRGTPTPTREGALGEASRFAEGQWVRVVDEKRVGESLDSRSQLRGLEFGNQQRHSCGRTYRVSKVVRRIIDDGGRLRPVSGTVLLDGVDCGGEDGSEGCGRFCPMMYRDEWLEEADAPEEGPAIPAPTGGPEAGGTFVEVRSMSEITKTLDPLGRHGGLMFMPEMTRYEGRRLRVSRRVDRVWELEAWVDVRAPVYILDGVDCSGDVLRGDGPCDRRCHILWHGDWLHFR